MFFEHYQFGSVCKSVLFIQQPETDKKIVILA